MATILITGGTGLIGKALTPMLTAKGSKVIILSRHPHKNQTDAAVSYATWDVQQQTIDNNAITAADYIIHLAGANVGDKRWTKKRKQEIVESRIKSSELIIRALQQTPNKVQAVISASATGWYGPDTAQSKQKAFKEDAPNANDFLGTTCKLWEESIEPVTAIGKRLVKLRTGIVLSNEGGALPEFKKPLKAGVAGILGSGEQCISWIHIDDICLAYIHAIENTEMSGAYNAVTPKPVTNKQLTLALAKQMRGSLFIPVHVPAFALKLALGEMSIEVLKSTNVCADKIRKAGFSFKYPSIEGALENLIKKK